MSAQDARERDAQLVRELSADLAPVRPIAPLLLRWLGAIGVALLVGIWALAGGGLRADLAAALGQLEYGAVAMGLLLAGALGTWAGLAASEPGRERDFARAATGAALALLAALGVCLAVVMLRGAAEGSPASSDAMCFRTAGRLSLLPVLAVVALGLRGWSGRPFLAGLVGVSGAVALAALAAHLGCPFEGARHLLLGHISAPLAIGALAGLPAGALLRRFGR